MKNRLFKSLTSLLLVVVMIASMLPVIPVTVNAADTEIVFEFGTNGSASHADGSGVSTYSETNNGYTLSITGGSSFYTGARDAKGNSCVKMGTSSKTGTFSFTVPADVTSVVIYAAKYKANTSKLSVNGTTYTLSGASNNGAYDEITVDTTITKTITVATVSGGVRAMINSIKFIIAAVSDCEHANTTTETVEPTCTAPGSVTVTCNDCGGTVSKETIPANHNYVDGSCSVCGLLQPDTTLTIEQAIELGTSYESNAYTEGKYYVTGTITEVYNSQYGNMYITDENGNVFTVYGTYSADGSTRYDAMDVKPVAGDTVTVYGIIGQYNGTAQMKNGWVVEHTPATPEEPEDTTAEDTTPEETTPEETTPEETTPEETTPEETTPEETTPEETTPEEPSTVEKVLSFASKEANRTEFSTTKQVWEQDGLKFINNKASSSTNVADYENPVRLYASSEIVLEAPSAYVITKIVFTANNGTYATALKNSIGDAATVSSSTVTVTLATPAESFTVAKLTAQVRINSLTVTLEKTGGCEHTNTEEKADGKAPTCTETGLTNTVVCSSCGETVTEQKEIPATGHTGGTATCTELAICDTCGAEYGNLVAHNYVDGVCTVCTAELPVSSTLSFDTKDNRIEYSNSIQVWKQNGITLTNNKGGSTTNVGDYAGPVRFYKNSEVIISAGAPMTVILFNVDGIGSDYVKPIEALADLETVDSVEKIGNNYVVTLTAPVTEFSFTASAATRINSVTVYYKAPETPKVTDYYVSLDKGVTINVEYTVTQEWLDLNAGAKVQFVSDVLGTVELPALVAGANNLSVTLTPKAINAALTLDLVVGGETVKSKDASFTMYYNAVKGQNDDLDALLDAIVNYGLAATGEATFTETFDGVDAYDKTETNNEFGGISSSLADSANVRLGINKENIGENYTVVVEFLGNTILSDNLANHDLLIINGIYAADFDEEITITVKDGETTVASATFTFNEYLKVLYGQVPAETQSIIAAAYQYGLATEAYKAATQQ